jgi:putative DNA primase/helicase
MTDALTLLRTDVEGGATKSFIRAKDGAISTTAYARVALWRVETRPVASFDELARELEQLVEDQQSMVIRARAKPDLDLSKPQRRKLHGADATFDDVPRQWLHLDLDNIAAPHLDVVGDPSGAIDYALDIVAASAPEIEGASCFAMFSSSAGVRNATAAKLHLWFWLDRPYSGAELKRWALGVNARAGSKLIDPQLFVGVQPNYTARPRFAGMPDPLPGRRRWAIRPGYSDTVQLDIPTEETKRARTSTSSGAAYGPGGGFAFYLSRIDGEGPHGLRDPAKKAIAARIAELGAAGGERERSEIVGAVADALRRAKRGGRSEATVEQYVDGLDDLFDWLIDRQRESEAKATQATPTYADASVPIEESERAVEGAVARFFARVEAGEAPAMALAVSTGVGKTRAAQRGMARTTFRAAMPVPRHRLSDELIERAQALGVTAQAWRGREARNPSSDDDSSMCIEPAIHAAAKRADAVEAACAACPSLDRCPYQAQRTRDPARLEILANNFMTRRPPAAVVQKATLTREGREVDILLVDEQFADRMVDEPRELLLDALTLMPVGLGVLAQADLDAMRAPLRRALRAAREAGHLRLDHLAAQGIDEDWCRRGEAAEWKAKGKVELVPGAADEIVAQLRTLAGRFDSRPAHLWHAVRQFIMAAESEMGRRIAQRLMREPDIADSPILAGAIELLDLDTDSGTAAGVRFRVRRELREEWRGKPTLILDAATLPDDAKLARIIRRPVESIEVVARMPESVTVTQLVEPAPISAFVSRDGESKRRLADATMRVEIMARQYAGQGGDGIDMLVVGGTIEIADLMRADLVARGLDVAPKGPATRPHAIEVRHCGDLAGEDRYRAVRAVVLAGWCLPPAPALERAIGAETGIMPGRRTSVGYPMAPAALRMRDGTGRAVVRPVHPDPAVEGLRWQKTEGEMLQALGRARWSRRTAATPLDMLILSDLPLPEIPVDRAVRWADIEVFRLERAFWRLGRVLPLRPEDLARTGLWPTAAAADRDLGRSKGDNAFIGISLKGLSPFEHRYRRPGQTRWSSALVDPVLPAARIVELLRAATGEPELIVELGDGVPKVAATVATLGDAVLSSTATITSPPDPEVADDGLDPVEVVVPVASSVLAVLAPVLLAGAAEIRVDAVACGAVLDAPDDAGLLVLAAQLRRGIEAHVATMPPWPVSSAPRRSFTCSSGRNRTRTPVKDALPVAPSEIRRQLRSRGLRVEDLARLAGIARPTLANALSGRYRLGAAAQARLLDELLALPPPRTGDLLDPPIPLRC